ncbi:coenzyme F420-0:L-glutamate ligase [Nitrosopumilus sp.]|uniref:coenzyme F420-0:L-glutamate ligase n=1 Tax=Nitrosopumilus sp. TaxID=2024843 RepID=UPI002607960C|nr:coenzyme F420-0:L-glutamate ligase [Nitrosopumilus sp.]
MQIIPVHIKKEIDSSDNLSDLLLNATSIEDGDIIVVAQKIISKNEGRIVTLSSVSPSLLAEGIASQYKKDPRIVELVLSETKRIVRMNNGIIIVETNHGFVCANAGVDESNMAEGFATLLPINSDKSAENIRKSVKDSSQKNIAVLISDTFGRPFRMGQTNCAIGISGMAPLLDYEGTLDSFQKILRVTEIAVSDELCAAAELVMKKTTKCPFVIIRGYSFDFEDHGIEKIIRSENEDLFR